MKLATVALLSSVFAVVSACTTPRAGDSAAPDAHAGIIAPRTGAAAAPPVTGAPDVLFPQSTMAIAPDQGETTIWSSAEMTKVAQELEARARRGQPTEDPTDLMSLPLTRTHLFSFAYVSHDAPPAAEQHEGVAEIIFVSTGAGEIVAGGEIPGRAPAASYGEYRGPTVGGGEHFKVKAGDIVTIPPNVPHMVTADAGGLSRLAVKINVGVYPWSLVANPGYTDDFVKRHPEVADRFTLHMSAEHGKPSHWPIERLKHEVEAMKARETSNQLELTYMPMEMPYMPWTPTYFMAYARRAQPSRPEQHEGVTDLHYVFDGSATMVIGGTIPDKTSPRAPGEYNGDTIVGGKTIHVKAGDIVSIPPNVPHSATPDPGGYARVNLKINVGLYPWGLVSGSRR